MTLRPKTAIQPGRRRRPLRIALASALAAQKRGTFGERLAGAASPLDLILKSSPALRFPRRTELRQYLHIHPSLQLLMRAGVEAEPRTEARTPERSISATLARIAPAMILERRVQERLIERTVLRPMPVVQRVLHRFTPSSRGSAPGRALESNAVVRQAPQRLPQPVHMTVRVVQVASSKPAADIPAPVTSVPAFGRDRSQSPHSPAPNDMPIDRIAEQVVRALDARMVAWRERMGRS